MKKHYTNIEVRELPHSEIEISGEIDASFLDECFGTALESMIKNAEFPGFRKGKVPKEILIQRVGELSILEEAAHTALDLEYPKIIIEKKIQFIGRPRIQITKLAKGNPLGFTIHTSVVPSFSLPPYKAIAKKEIAKEENLEATEKEIDDVLSEMQKHQAHMKLHESGNKHDHANPNIEEKDLPVIDDAFAKTMGDFKDLADMKEKIKENLGTEKKNRIKEKKRTAIMETIINETKIDTPEILIESELEKMLLEFKGDIERAGLSYDDYLKTVTKTEEQIRAEWKETAEKKAKAHLIISKIADEEKISPDEEKVRRETEKILMMYKDADPVRARAYVAMILTNEKVFEFLENQK